MSKLTETMRSEAAEYRQGSDRPLRGYAVLMILFSGLAGAAGAAAALWGTRSRRISPYDLLLMTAATHKLARLITKDAVTSPVRAPFTHYRGEGGPGEVTEEVRKDGQMRHAVGELLTCPFCLSIWVATGFTIGSLFAPRVTRVVTSTFTAVAGADYLQLLYARMQQAAEEQA
jgi:hypothetical protein